MKRTGWALILLASLSTGLGCHHQLNRNQCRGACQGRCGQQWSSRDQMSGRQQWSSGHNTTDYVGPVPHGMSHINNQGPSGPPTGSYAYPYYTTRGPRDFLQNNPPSIGR